LIIVKVHGLVEVTHEASMKEYKRLLRNPPKGPLVPLKPPRTQHYSVEGRSVVAMVHSESRIQGLEQAISLIGGMDVLCKGVEGDILIKPNCNTDDPYPRDTHPDTIRTIADMILATGFPHDRIVVGEISGRYRGLPTRYTLENLGIKGVADELGLRVCCFDEEEWVTVKPPESKAWPDGIKIPRQVNEADRVILTPILRSHSNAVFTMSLKLAVGMIDAVSREWLHDGRDFMEKMVELNLAYSADMVVADATRVYTGSSRNFRNVAEPGVIIAGSNRVATDAVCAALLKHYGTYGVEDGPILGQKQLKVAERLSLGSPRLESIDLRTLDTVGDGRFQDLVSYIEGELGEGASPV
jgi:uncharacterized protein (DUF362 family)